MILQVAIVAAGSCLRLRRVPLFASEAWNQVKTRLEFLAQHHGVGLLTGEVGAGKSTAARAFTATLHPNLYKILYVHFSSGSALDLLRQVARTRISGPPGVTGLIPRCLPLAAPG